MPVSYTHLIGHGVGAMAISGLAISFPLMNLLVAFCTLVGVGGATISSIRLGQKDTCLLYTSCLHIILIFAVHEEE